MVQDHVAVVTECLPESDLQLQKIREATLKDPQLAILHRVLQTSWPTRYNLQKILQRFLALPASANTGAGINYASRAYAGFL